MFAQQEPFSQQGDSSPAVLAMLDVEPDDNKDASRDTSHDSGQQPGLQPLSEATIAATEMATAALADSQKLGAVGAPEEPSPAAVNNEAPEMVATTPEPEKTAQVEPDFALGEGSSAVERAATTSALDTKIASAAESETKTVAALAAAEPINLPAVAPEPIAPNAEIAALGGSPEAPKPEARDKGANNTSAAPGRDVSRLRALRAAKARRRLARRAQILRRAALLQQQQQQQLKPFIAVPATTTAPAAENPYRF